MSPLLRLRLAFITLGVTLLVPLGLLLQSANARLERQRELRYQMVGERIFDELERELTRVLEAEAQAEKDSFQNGQSEPLWEPYVVGYFRERGAQVEIAESAQLTEAMRARLTFALDEWKTRRGAAAEESPVAAPDRALEIQETEWQDDLSEAAPTKRTRATKTSDVLRQLNRGKDMRSQSASSRAEKASSARSPAKAKAAPSGKPASAKGL